VTDNDEIQERYEAAGTLHVWFRHLAGMDGTSEVLTAAANGLMKLYLESGEEVRVAIETGTCSRDSRPSSVFREMGL